MIPKISVILPVYNAGVHLKRCMESVLSQGFSDFEVVAVVDCPTDGSDEVCRRYAETDGRIRMFYNSENLHIGNSRNRGLQEARGEYVLFVDHDDVLAKDAMQMLYCAAKQTEADIVYSYSGETDDRVKTIERQIVLRNLIGGGELSEMDSDYSCVTGNLYKTDLAKSVAFVDTKTISAEDKLYNIEVVHKADIVATAGRNVYTHVVHGGNEGGKRSYYGYVKRGKAMEYIYNKVTEWGEDEWEQYLYDGINKQAVRLLGATLPFHPLEFLKTRRYLRNTACFRVAWEHYRIPEKKMWVKKMYRRFIVRSLS